MCSFFVYLYKSFSIGRSVRSTTASVIQIPPTTTTPPTTPIIPKKITKPRQSVRYKSPTGPVSRRAIVLQDSPNIGRQLQIGPNSQDTFKISSQERI